MSEAKEKCAFLEDVDEGIFVRFTEYAYTGDYSVPDPDIILTSSDVGVPNGVEDTDNKTRASASLARLTIESDAPPAAPEPAGPEDDWGSFGLSSKKDKKGKGKKGNAWREDLAEPEPPLEIEEPRETKSIQLWSAFVEKAHVRHHPSWEPRQNEEAFEDYTQVLLCHARLYVFSDLYQIEPLQQLARQKLRLTLSRFFLFEERVSDVVELIKYTYQNTMDHESGLDKLRSLVIDYVVCHIETIAKDKDFQKMLQDSGALANDLIQRLIPRLD